MKVLYVLSAVALPSSDATAQQIARSANPVASRPARHAALMLNRVNVVDVEAGKVRPAQRVLIVGSRIQVVGAADKVRIPSGTRIIDARGKYLIPGLWDMHVHPKSFAPLLYPLFVANGITGVRDAGSNTPLATFTQWKREIAAGTRVGPRLFVAGPSILECPVPIDGPDGNHAICVTTPSEVRLAVDFLKLAGADFIKPYMMSPALYRALVAEAHRLGIPFGGHFSSISGLEASDSGASFLDHETWFTPDVCGQPFMPSKTFDRDACAAAIERLRRNGTWLVDTRGAFGLQLFPATYFDRLRRYYPDSIAARFGANAEAQLAERARLFPGAPGRPTSLADWRAVLQSPASPWAHDTSADAWIRHYYVERRGMPVVAGSDVSMGSILGGFAGYSLHEVLVSLVLSGMTPLEALRTATLNPAQAMRLSDSLGTIAAGKLADLVLLDANPLADIWNTTTIRAVFTNGFYYDRVALDHLLAATAQAAHH